MNHEESKSVEQKLDNVKAPAESSVAKPILDSKDNAIQKRAELILMAKSFKITSDTQMPFQLQNEDGSIVKSTRPPRKETPAAIADGARVDSSAGDEQKFKGASRNNLHGEIERHSGPGEKAAEAPKKDHESRVDRSREHLEDTAKHLLHDGKMSEKEYEQFKRDANQLRERVRHGYVDANEAAGVYEQMDKMMTSPKAVISEKNRILLAENVVHHAAYPHLIDQGIYNTCNMTTVEEHMFTHKPASAAEIVTSAALHGSFKSGPPTQTIFVDGKSLWPQPESLTSPPQDGSRSYASQVLNVLLVNDVLQREHPPRFYHQIPAGIVDASKPNGDATHRKPGGGDNGERLTDAAGHEIIKLQGGVLVPDRSPGDAGTLDNIASEVRRLTGDTGVVIGNKVDGWASPDVVKVGSSADLENALRHHKMPMIIGIDANNPPWNYGAAQPAWHVVTIRSYDAAKHIVHISNQWGARSDIDIPVAALYNATLEYHPPAPPPVPHPPGH